MKYLLSLFLVLTVASMLSAETFQVGPTRTYTTPNALYAAGVLNDGDIIEIDGGNYLGTATLANWQQNNLIIRGVNGRPHLQANGQYILGKGIWVFSGNNITVENIEFSGTTVPSENGAGIRLDGLGMTVRNCYFHDNENGILATSASVEGVILVEHSEFADNGFGDGFTHNIYVNNADKLIFRFNYSHHAKVGHNLKSRADTNYIYCNRIMDEETGNSSRLIDLPNGGPAIVIGNLLMQGNNAPNNNLVGYGLEGLSSPAPHDLYFVNNTCVNKRVASCRFLQVQSGTNLVHYANNIFTGEGTILTGSPTSTIDEGNLIDENIANLKFVNEPNYDYHLAVGSPAIEAGGPQSSAHSFPLTPSDGYLHLAQKEPRTLEGLKIDAGAYEQESVLPVDLIAFEAVQVVDRISVRWQTAQELNHAGFELRKGRSLTLLEKHDWIAANAYMSGGAAYKYDDANPLPGLNYYQLRQIDVDGTYWESQVVAVDFNADASFSICPNPASTTIILKGIEPQWQLYNDSGQQIARPQFDGENLQISHLATGLYFIRTRSGASHPFIKS